MEVCQTRDFRRFAAANRGSGSRGTDKLSPRSNDERRNSSRHSRALGAIFCAGLLCGVLDINAAFVTWWSRGVRPLDILHVIASGWIGRRSFAGGVPTAALGLALHFLIAFSAAAVFYAASRRWTFLIERPVVSGIVYGVCVYAVMYWMVIPLSHYHPPAFSWFNASVAVVTHIVCVGLPISLVVARFSK